MAIDDYRESRAFRMALDSLLPGWFDIDLSDHTGAPGQVHFVSNDPREWFEWMIRHGIEEEEAKKLLAQCGHHLQEEAS